MNTLDERLRAADPARHVAGYPPEVAETMLAGITRPIARPRTARRWGLSIAAAAVLVAVGLMAQALAPLGSVGSPQAAEALDRLALAVVEEAPIPEGHYELTVTEDRGTAQVENVDTGKQEWYSYTSTRSTWLAPDGWSWARQTGEDAAHFIFSPIQRPYSLDAVPPDPVAIEAYLRARVMGSSSVDEAIFKAISSELMFSQVPAEHRAAAIRALARVPGITVTEDTIDPAGRPAIQVAFVDPDRRPGQTQSIYFDPTDSQLVAVADVADGRERWVSVYTERRIVEAVPADVLAVVGTERVERAIWERDGELPDAEEPR